MLDNDDIVALLKRDLEAAQGYDSDVLSDKRAKAYDYYYGKMQSPSAGRSAYVSTDVADTVTALMSQVGMIYRSSSVMFTANNEQDEQQARLESDVIKAVIEQNDDFEIFEQATFDALLVGNGWIKVGLEIEEETVVQKVTAQTPEEEEFFIQAFKQTADDAQISRQVTASGVELVASFAVASNQLCVEAVPPENMLFSGTEQTRDLNDMTLVAERKLYTVSDLVGMGLSEEEAMSIPSYGDLNWQGSIARQGQYADTFGNGDFAQNASQLKETFICYYLLDDSESGEVTRYRIHLAGDIIIEKDQFDYVPYVTGSPLPIPHMVTGRGMYEVMKPIQDSKTSITRNYLDNLSVMNQSRVAYLKGEVDVEDLINGRINGIVGVERPDAIIPLPSNDIGQQAITGLNYMDQARTAKGGASVDLNGAEMQVAKSSAMAAAGEFQLKEQAAAFYSKNLAQTLLKNTFLMVHRVLREDFNELIEAKINGQWTQVNPADWQNRKRAKIAVGLSNSEKAQKINSLNQILMWQTQVMQSGLDGVLVDIQNIFNAAQDWITASGVSDHPDEYLINPMSPQAQQAQQSKAQQQAQQQQMMAQQQEQMFEMQAMLEEIKAQNDKELKRMELDWKYYDTDIDAGMKEAQMTIDTVTNIRGKNENNQRGDGQSAA